MAKLYKKKTTKDVTRINLVLANMVWLSGKAIVDVVNNKNNDKNNCKE